MNEVNVLEKRKGEGMEVKMNEEIKNVEDLIRQWDSDFSVIRLEDNVVTVIRGELENGNGQEKDPGLYVPKTSFASLVDSGRVFIDKVGLVDSIKREEKRLFGIGSVYFLSNSGWLYFQLNYDPSKFKNNGHFEPITYLVPVEKINLTEYLRGYN